MSGFRLGRLVRLRERQEREEKLRWAAALRSVHAAQEQRAAGREALAQAHLDLMERVGEPSSPERRIAAETTLDHLGDRKVAQEQAVDAAEKASGARVEVRSLAIHDSRISLEDRTEVPPRHYVLARVQARGHSGGASPGPVELHGFLADDVPVSVEGRMSLQGDGDLDVAIASLPVPLLAALFGRDARLEGTTDLQASLSLDGGRLAAARADLGDQGQDHVFAGHPLSQRAGDVDLEGLRAPLQQALGGQDVLHLAGADAERQRPEGAMGRGVAVTTHDRHPGLRAPKLRPDHVNDAVVVAAQGVQRDVELGAVGLQLAQLLGGLGVQHVEAAQQRAAAGAADGRCRVVHGRQGAIGPPHPKPTPPFTTRDCSR